MNDRLCTAFEGFHRLAHGGLAQVTDAVKTAIERGGKSSILTFDDATGEQIDLDFRTGVFPAETPPEPEEGVQPRRPGRPKLGVVAREVTLLPRHWEWLSSQPGGASVALRKLVDEARRVNAGVDRVRRAREAAYRFLSAIAGNEPGFEEATRALFAGNVARFEASIAAWPVDVRDYAKKLSADGFAQ